MSAPSGKRGRMPTQLSLAEARRRGPRIAVLPDAARVEERLGDLARQRDFVPFRIAFSVAELGRELIREAQRAGSCPEVASRFAVQLALRQAARDHSPGPYFAVRNHAGYERALGDLLAALSEGLLEPEELAALDLGGRALALGRTLAAARDALGRVGLADPHRALRLAVEHVERGGALPRELADAAALEFDCVLDWTPLRLRLAKALATRLRVRIRLPWSGGRSDLTDLLEPTLRAIEKLAERARELEWFDPAERAPALAPSRRRLFAADGPPADAPVGLVCCAPPGARAREGARRCAALIRSGAAADSIAVAARSLANGAAQELGAAFDRVGVPWRERRGRPALPVPTVRLALSLLELIEQDFPREPLIGLLSCRLVWLAEDGDRLPPAALARVLRESHARDDATAGGYATALSSLARRLERKERGAAHVEETSRRVQRVIAALRGLPAQGTLREHGAALLELLGRWGLWRRLRVPEPVDAGPALDHAAVSALGRDQAAARAPARGAAQFSAGPRVRATGACSPRVRGKSRCFFPWRSARPAARPRCSGPAPTRRGATPCARRSRTRRRGPSARSRRSCRSSRSLWRGIARMRPTCSRALPSTRSRSPPTGSRHRRIPVRRGRWWRRSRPRAMGRACAGSPAPRARNASGCGLSSARSRQDASPASSPGSPCSARCPPLPSARTLRSPRISSRTTPPARSGRWESACCASKSTIATTQSSARASAARCSTAASSVSSAGCGTSGVFRCAACQRRSPSCARSRRRRWTRSPPKSTSATGPCGSSSVPSCTRVSSRWSRRGRRRRPADSTAGFGCQVPTSC